jgi:HSP20 family protein
VEVIIMAIVRWDPFGEALRLQRDMDRVFARLGAPERTGAGAGESVAWMPRIDVKRTGDDIVVRAELPGIKPEDVDIELTDNVLTIRGERKLEEEKENEGWLVRESTYGSFERALSIPEGVDPASITASYTDGMLEVHVPKALEAVKPRTTKIEVAKG